jgi:inhibitor of KinA sporulation pathway (predicted exonuclease)
MLIVLDLEATCWAEPNILFKSEIIEIGAVKVDLKTNQIVDTFDALIRPTINPELSDYCTNLTGISTDMVRGSEYFWQVYPKFVRWAGSKQKGLIGAWGDYDKRALERDVNSHNLDWELTERYLNISHFYLLKKGGKKRGLLKAATESGITFDGPQHRALSDALVAAKIFLTLLSSDLT